MMDFSVQFNKVNDTAFCFSNGVFYPENLFEGEPNVIHGHIYLNEKEIGHLELYELYNDKSFYYKCDNASSDCEIIASTICGKNGNVLKKYLANCSQYDSIFILDRISINNEYRGMGIGTEILRNLLDMLIFQFDTVCAVFLCASDYETAEKHGFDSKEYIDGCKKLSSFYKKAGFTHIKNNVFGYTEK